MAYVSAQSRLRVALLAGGDSPERVISLASGEQAFAALRQRGHRVEMFDPATTPVQEIPWQQFDVCFLAMHGGAGEDGRLQQRLETLGVPFTGSGSSSARLAMCKSASKERFLQANLPTQPYVLLHQSDPMDDVVAKTAALEWPLVVKPDSQGSSLGLGVARTEDELHAAIAAAFQFDPFVLIEPLIVGRELTVAILGRQPLPPIEIVTAGGLFDYEAKYESAMTEYRCDTGLPVEDVGRIEQLAVAAAEAVRSTGLARVDLIVDCAFRPWLLEVNTIPGLTEHSLAPKAARQAGWSLGDLCQWMLEDCLAHSEVHP